MAVESVGAREVLPETLFTAALSLRRCYCGAATALQLLGRCYCGAVIASLLLRRCCCVLLLPLLSMAVATALLRPWPSVTWW